MLYQGYDFTGAFAVSAILVLMAVMILVLRSVLENKKRQRGSNDVPQSTNPLEIPEGFMLFSHRGMLLRVMNRCLWMEFVFT